MAQEEEVLGKAYDSRLMKRLIEYLRPYKWQTGIALGSILLKVGADVLGPYLTKVVIDRYLSPVPGGHTLLDRFLSSRPLVGIAQVAAIGVGLLIFSFLLDYLQIYFMQWAGQMVMFDLRREIFRHLQRMHIGFYDKNPVGRLVTRTTSDVDALNEMFTSGVVSIFEDVFVLAGIVWFMLRMNRNLALITFAVLPLIAFATKIFRDKVRDSYRRIRTAIARINSYMQEHVSGMVVLQLFNREKRAFKKFSDVNAVHMDAFKDAIMAHAVYYPVVEILSATAIACVIWFGGNDVIRGATTIGVLAAFIQYAQRFFRPIQDFSEKYNILQSAMAASERVFKLLDTPVEITSPAVTKTPTGPGRIEFDHVWFAYRNAAAGVTDGGKHAGEGARATQPGATQTKPAPGNGRVVSAEPDWILRDVSFTIEPGETVAIVGHTGAGKTTIISLLMRFYDVQKGAVKIDGIDVKEMDLSDFVRSLPGGFEEEVRERGSTRSTGQKQLISFARALAHDPRILILDEATSSVDTETEFRVRDALNRMVEGRTSIIIAHRLSTVQRADKIIVMHKGQVREMGTHQQLLGQRGIYYKLYQLQYKDQEVGVARAPSPATPSNGSPRSEVTTSADD